MLPWLAEPERPDGGSEHAYSAGMQLLIPFVREPEDYISSGAERRLPAPSKCPNCGHDSRLLHHGYYERYVASRSTGEALRLRVRRLRCRECRLTTSLLPWFCLPYRLVCGESVARYLRGDGIESYDLRWQGLLVRCHQRFRSWRPLLAPLLLTTFGLDIGAGTVRSSWLLVERALGDIAGATAQLVRRCGVTLLGRYRCHCPGCSRSSAGSYHTSFLFSRGRSPPK